MCPNLCSESQRRFCFSSFFHTGRGSSDRNEISIWFDCISTMTQWLATIASDYTLTRWRSEKWYYRVILSIAWQIALQNSVQHRQPGVHADRHTRTSVQWLSHQNHSKMWTSAPALTGRKYLCWMLWKPPSALQAVCMEKKKKKSWAISTKEQINHPVVPFSKAQIHFICATFLQSLKSILRKHLFTCRLRYHAAVSGPAVINVNLSVVGALEHRKHSKAMQISREHLGFGNSLICFAANFDFGAAWFTQVVTWGFHIAVSWVVAGQNRLMKTEETQQLQHRARKASDSCLCFIWGLFCLSLLFLERDKKTRVCMVNTVYSCTPYIQHNLSIMGKKIWLLASKWKVFLFF